MSSNGSVTVIQLAQESKSRSQSNADSKRVSLVRRTWTDEEDQLVREYGPKISVQRLAVRLKRPQSSVVARAKVLNVALIRARRLPPSGVVLDRDTWRRFTGPSF